MTNLWKIPVLILLVILLVLIRMYEDVFFYDPFMYFFEGGRFADSQLFPIRWYVNVGLRFLANTLISLVIIYVVFNSKSLVKFSALLYGILFLILFPLFVVLMERVETDEYLLVFYVRRILIQPILLLLLLPAFYYQRLKV